MHNSNFALFFLIAKILLFHPIPTHSNGRQNTTNGIYRPSPFITKARPIPPIPWTRTIGIFKTT